METGKWPEKKKLPHAAEKLIFLFACVLLVELFVFNFRHWESLGNKQETWRLSVEDMEMESGYVSLGDGILTVVGDMTGILIEDLDSVLDTTCIDIQVVSGSKEEQEQKPVIIRQWAMDESHRFFYELPEREIWKKEKRSTYITYHLYGKCTGLRIVPELSIGQTISVRITLNPVIPMFFSWERVFVLFLIVCLVYALKPSSVFHRVQYMRLSALHRKILLVLFFVIHMLLFWKLTRINPYFQTEVYDNQRQYQELAESLKAGSFALLDEPSGALSAMENPYDLGARNQVMEETGESYKWDHVYYNGKYYVYFGVIPAVLFYLPFYAITGVHLHNNVLIFFLSLLFMAGCLGVVHEMVRRWFPKTTSGLWFLLNELLLMGSGIIYMTKRPDLYTVPILSGLAFGMLGLWCFFLAGKRDKISLRYTGAGSLFMAFIAGCRPQLFLFAALAVAVLWDSVRTVIKDAFHGGITDGKASRKQIPKAAFSTICGMAISIAFPMALLAGGLMYYNYSRFGSVFDFGANYNLTMNDMRNRGFVLDRIPLGTFAYMFQPVKLIQKFPFVEAVYFDSQYMGVTIQEATYGGIFAANLFTWFGVCPVFLHKYFRRRDKTPWLFVVICLIITCVIIAVDTNMSGILQRYFGDFSIFLMLASTVSFLLIMEKLSDVKPESDILKKILLWMLLVCLLWQTGYQGMTFFLDTGESLRELRPDLYSHAKYLADFLI